jgi:hypothetical protein
MAYTLSARVCGYQKLSVLATPFLFINTLFTRDSTVDCIVARQQSRLRLALPSSFFKYAPHHQKVVFLDDYHQLDNHGFHFPAAFPARVFLFGSKAILRFRLLEPSFSWSSASLLGDSPAKTNTEDINSVALPKWLEGLDRPV